MKCNKWLLGIIFLYGFSAFSQEKFIKHTVSKGETITKIAQQYDVKQSVIFELNPDAKNGIKYKTILLIPTSAAKNNISNTQIATNYPSIKHEVLPKETLYGIAKQYGVTVEDLNKINPTLGKSGLRKGQKINIPGTEQNQNNSVAVTNHVNSSQKSSPLDKTTRKEETVLLSKPFASTEAVSEMIVREILPSETKYAIAREYGITVADLDKANPILETEALQIGQKIFIPVKEGSNIKTVDSRENLNNEKLIVAEEKVKPKTASAVAEESVIDTKIEDSVVTREVLPKETKYGIAKEYGISVKELERQNPKIVQSLPIGFKLTIRSPKSVLTDAAKEESKINNQTESGGPSYNQKSFHGVDFLDQLVSRASENIGTRYQSGGTTKDGFDCSGLMCTTFGAFDIQLPRTSIEQSRFGVKIDNADAQKGDLIFFKTNGRRQINHVGMVVEVNDGDIKFIHASVGGGVIISSVKERYYSKKVSQINRVL